MNYQSSQKSTHKKLIWFFCFISVGIWTALLVDNRSIFVQMHAHIWTQLLEDAMMKKGTLVWNKCKCWERIFQGDVIVKMVLNGNSALLCQMLSYKQDLQLELLNMNKCEQSSSVRLISYKGQDTQLVEELIVTLTHAF